MNGITLRAPGTPLDGRPLGEGMHDIGGAGIRVDRRGHWLLLEERAPGAHVNGRPVRRIALLRPGDSVHVGGRSFLLEGGTPPPAPPAPPARPTVDTGPAGIAADARVLLRGIGGRHHGRGITLERPLDVGSDAGADIRLEPPVAARHARIGLEAGRVVLRAIAGGEVVVNGNPVHDAELCAGDQLLVGGRDRFVVEAPCDPPALFDAADPREPAAEPATANPRPMHRLPWLLLVALLIAGLLSGLLLL